MLDQFIKMPVAQKVLILVLVMALVAVGFWFGFYSPLQDELAQYKNQHQNLSNKLVEVQKREKTYNEDVQRREDLKIASVKQRQMLPVETEMASFLNNLNTVADLTGLEIMSVKPMEASPEKYYARIPVKLELHGSYLQLAKFFYQVGKLDRIINIENINLGSPEVSEGGTLIKASVLATTFRSLETGK